MEGYYAVGAFVSEDVCNQSPVYPGTAKSVKLSSNQGYSEGDDKYQACFQYVEVPARLQATKNRNGSDLLLDDKNSKSS